MTAVRKEHAAPTGLEFPRRRPFCKYAGLMALNREAQAGNKPTERSSRKSLVN
jgi:hypothetical protein